MIIMIMVKISAWGSPNLQYLDMGVTGQKGWETLLYTISSILNRINIHMQHNWEEQNIVIKPCVANLLITYYVTIHYRIPKIVFLSMIIKPVIQIVPGSCSILVKNRVTQDNRFTPLTLS